MLFSRKKKEDTAIVVRESIPHEIAVIELKDIKSYLVNEYERANNLESENENLKRQIELAREIKLKYDAALVTLEEYSKRLENKEKVILLERNKVDAARKEADRLRDDINTYKVTLMNAALTKEEIEQEIIDNTKEDIIKAIFQHKGNLSKKIVCDIIGSIGIENNNEDKKYFKKSKEEV